MRQSWENEKFYKKSEKEQSEIRKQIEEKTKERQINKEKELEILRIEKSLVKDMNQFSKEKKIKYKRKYSLSYAYYIEDTKLYISFTLKNWKDEHNPQFARKLLLEKLYFNLDHLMNFSTNLISTKNKDLDYYVIYKILERCFAEANDTSLARKIIDEIFYNEYE